MPWHAAWWAIPVIELSPPPPYIFAHISQRLNISLTKLVQLGIPIFFLIIASKIVIIEESGWIHQWNFWVFGSLGNVTAGMAQWKYAWV